jgi:hypothetical protein
MSTASKQSVSPVANGGRADSGKFGPGNKFGKGNPRLKAIGEFQRALAEAATAADVELALKTIRDVMNDAAAKAADKLNAAALMLNRLCGLPDNAGMSAKLDELLADLRAMKEARL